MLGGKMGRELTLRKALAEAPRRVRADPDRLPAVARPADGQRARRRRLRADHRRGAVLRAAGRRAGDGGRRARARRASTPSCSCSACCSTSPTCAPSTRARRSPRCRSTSASRSSTPSIRSSIAYAESAERARSILDHRPDLGADYLDARRGSARACRALERRGTPRRAQPRRAAPPATAPRRRRPAARTARAGALAQPSTSRLQRLGDGAGLLVEAPDEHGRPGAGDRRAERAELARRAARARTSAGTGARGAAGAGGPAARGEQVPVAAREPEREQRAVRDVEDRVGERHLARAAPRARRCVRTASAGTTASASRPVGGSKRVAAPSAQIDEAAAQRRGDVVRVALELGARARAGRRRARRGGRRPSARRRSPRRSSRARPTAGSPRRSGT